jgi:putative protease
MTEVEVGKVNDFFARPVVAGVELSSGIKVGDRIRIRGHTTDLEFTIKSIQIDNQSVETAQAGDNIGVKVSERVRRGDTVYLVTG